VPFTWSLISHKLSLFGTACQQFSAGRINPSSVSARGIWLI
jgi:hypothetical protein